MKTLEIKEAVTEIVEVPRQKEAEPESAPSVIEIEFSEVDRQTAENYLDHHRCLICTALKNRGINVVSMYSNSAHLEDGVYNFEKRWDGAPGNLEWNGNALCKPFYGPAVVGKVIRLIKRP